MKNKPFFLKNVQLSGYKSIKNVDIDFENGLNIIIGKNAAGKTNFLSFLEKVLRYHPNKSHFDFNSKVLISGIDEFRIEINNKFNKEKNNNVNFIFNQKFIKNNIEIEHYELLNYYAIFVKHGIPLNYSFVDKPISIEIGENGINSEIFNFSSNSDRPSFTVSLFDTFLYNFFENKKMNLINIKETLNFIYKKIELLKSDLIKYSNINDVRISDNHNIFHNKEKEYFSITNLFLEFKIEDSWLPFSDLSDGTKRLFYIISEVAVHTNINENQLNVILLEEPELGIHPHQLHNLMQFLKEQAESKQIIISTHSPQVLNILGKNELNKIIIATSEGKKGTVLKHLTKRQKEKAESYMKDVFLSDYWMYSDLEEQI